MLLENVILYDTRANQPAAATVPVGALYYVTDENITERNNGATWDDFSDSGADTGITQLTGDVTAGPGNGSQAATIANDAVTYAKIQDVSATDRILLRDTAGAGVIEEGTATAGLEFSGAPGLRLTTAARTFTVGITIDGGGSAITTGVKGYIQVPVAGTITAWTLLADTSGDIVIDVWKDVFANFPPDNADSITAGDEPEIPASGTNATDSSLGSWTTGVDITAGDVLGFNVDSCTSITRATLTLVVVKTGS